MIVYDNNNNNNQLYIGPSSIQFARRLENIPLKEIDPIAYHGNCDLYVCTSLILSSSSPLLLTLSISLIISCLDLWIESPSQHCH